MKRVRTQKGVPINQFYLDLYEKSANRRTGVQKPKVKGAITGKGSKKTWPFSRMEVDTSFALPLKTVRKRPDQYPYEFRALAKAWGMHLNRKFLVLKDDNHQWRCWRTE